MTEFDFVGNIKSQSIFKKWFGRRRSIKGRSGNLLAINSNKDLFIAIENTIRCCTINSKSSNYKILASKNTQFDIKEIGLNPNGKLIYSTDYFNVTIQDFPSDINNSKAVNEPSIDLKLKGLEGEIKKIVWCPFSVYQMSLVVLQEGNIITLYDLSISESPVLKLKLNEEFKQFQNEIATSICFGSNENLQGGLSLYISTESAQIFAVYPFTGKEIWVTKEEVDTALTDSTNALGHLKRNYPNSDIDEVFKPISTQIDFFKRIYTQMNSHTWFGAKLINGKSTEAYKIICSSIPSIPMEQRLIGPLASLAVDTVSDIQSIGNNDQTLLIVAVCSSGSDLKVKYLAQISPLIMTWTKESSSLEINQPQIVVDESKKNIIQTKRSGYRRPPVGFGYIDDDEDDSEDDDEDDEEEEEDSGPATPESLNDKHDPYKHRVWDSINRIDIIGFDILSGVSLSKDCKIFPSSIDSNQFLIYTPTKFIYCKTKDWIYQLPDIRDVEIKNTYDLIDNNQRSNSAGLITDNITFTGDYLIKYKDYMNSENDDSGEEDEVKVILINDPVKSNTLNHASKTELATTTEKPVIISKLDSSLLTEIQHDVMKFVQHYQKPNQKISSQDTDVEILDKVNKFSVDSIAQINNFDTLLMKLNLKLAANLIELNYQVSTYNQMKPTRNNKKNSERLQKLKNRQEVLHKRLSELHTKLALQVEQIKINNRTPISKAETEWFNEINAITEKLNGPDSELPKLIEDLTVQVDYIKTNKIKPSEALAFNQVKDIKKIKTVLTSQSNDSANLKNQVDDLAHKFEEIF